MSIIISSKKTEHQNLTLVLSNILVPAFENAYEVKIATGYASGEAIDFLLNYIKQNNRPRLILFVGMHYVEQSFSSSQFNSLLELNQLLVDKGLGKVLVSPEYLYHGKMYAFLDDNKNCNKSSIGSSNLGSIFSADSSIIESDFYSEDSIVCNDISKKIDSVMKEFGVNISEVSTPSFRTMSHPLKNVDGVTPVTKSDLDKVRNSLTDCSFILPLKTVKKSNLNIYNGKPRINNGIPRPRPWYEAEIIVGKKITGNNNYPKGKDPFVVVTSDGWMFECITSGDYNKNFRSYRDLRILGRWVKGAMEMSGVLSTGQMIDASVLKSFGFSHITLTKTSIDNTWYLEFTK